MIFEIILVSNWYQIFDSGTKANEYLLGVNEHNEFEKYDFDPEMQTRAENSLKMARFVRCKIENLHAGY